MTLNNKIVFDFIASKNNKSLFLTEYAAIFGSINSFKYFIANNFKIPRYIIKKAIRGGEQEIIDLCIAKGYQINDPNFLNTSIKYHQNKIYKWLVNSTSLVSKDPSICISSYNFKAFLKTEFDDFNFIFELIDFNNILLIELISPFLHNFIQLIIAYYSIIKHSNEIASFLYDSIDEMRYPFDYLQNLNKASEKLKFNSIIKSCKNDKFEKNVIFLSFCFITDNIDFLRYLLLIKNKNRNKKEIALFAFKALCYCGLIFNNFRMTSCQKFIFSFISGFADEDQVLSLYLNDENNSTLSLLFFEQFNDLKLKFSKVQLDSIVLSLLKKLECRSILLKNYKQFVTNECLLEFLNEIKDDFDVYFELISYESIDANIVLTSYLNKISLKYRPESRENRFNSSLTYRRLITSSSEREKEKKIINLCSSHSLFDVNYEVDEDRNSYLHLIVINDLDYILRFIFTNPIFRQILNKCNKFNKTPFSMAVEFQNIECIQILIEQNGLNFISCDSSEMNAFNYAIQNNLTDFVLKIIELKKISTQNNKNKINSRKNDNSGFNIVGNVSKTRHVSPICCSKTKEMIELLLSQGAQPSTFNGVDKNGKTLLVNSLESSSFDFQFLFEKLKGIDLNGQCEDGKTFIMKSIELNKYQSVIDYLDNNPIQQTEQRQQSSTKVKSSLSSQSKMKSTNLSDVKSSPTKSNENKYSNSSDVALNSSENYFIDYTIKSRENSCLASALRANNPDLIEKFLSISIKSGNDQAALIESMKQSKSSDSSSIAAKLVSSFKKKLELTPQQVVEDIVKIPEKYFEFIFKEEKDPHKAFNFVYNDQTVLISSIKNKNNSLFKFLLSKNDLINLDLNWCNSKGQNCFDVAIELQNKEITEILFNETKLNKSLHSFIAIIVQKNKYSCSLKLNEEIKNKWVSDTLKKKKVQLFELIIENNNINLFNLIINEVDKENLINKGFAIALSKRSDTILNTLLNHELLNPDFAINLAIQQNSVALLKKLISKFNGNINMNKFVEIVMNSNSVINNIFVSYANISDYSRRLLKNDDKFSFTVSDVENLLLSCD